MAPSDEPLYSTLFPFYHGLDIAIVAVPHPARYLLCMGHLTR
jgi:hypothetical protein